RGTDVLGAFVTSEVNDSNPSNDSVLQVLDWVPQVNTSLRLVSEYPESLPGGGYRFRAEIRNDGPSTAIQMNLNVSGSHQEVGCTATNGATCGDQSGSGYVDMPAQSTIALSLDFPPFAEPYNYHQAAIWAVPAEWNTAHNWSLTILY